MEGKTKKDSEGLETLNPQSHVIKEKTWNINKAFLDALLKEGKISETLYYFMAKNIRKRLGLPIQE